MPGARAGRIGARCNRNGWSHVGAGCDSSPPRHARSDSSGRAGGAWLASAGSLVDAKPATRVGAKSVVPSQWPRSASSDTAGTVADHRPPTSAVMWTTPSPSGERGGDDNGRFTRRVSVSPSWSASRRGTTLAKEYVPRARQFVSNRNASQSNRNTKSPSSRASSISRRWAGVASTIHGAAWGAGGWHAEGGAGPVSCSAASGVCGNAGEAPQWMAHAPSHAAAKTWRARMTV